MASAVTCKGCGRSFSGNYSACPFCGVAVGNATGWAQQARQALSRNDRDMARNAANAALGLDQGCLEAHLVLGDLELEKPEGAAFAFARFEQALHADPHSTHAHLGRSRAMAMLGKREEAMEGCRALLALDPELGAGCLLLGKLLLMDGELEEALSAFERAKSDEPSRGRALLGAATCLHKLSRPKEAVEACLSARMYEASVESSFLLAELHVALDDIEQALTWFQDVAGNDSAPPRLKEAAANRVKELETGAFASVMRAKAAAKRGSLPETIAAFEEALRHEPDNAYALRELSVALALAKRMEDALQLVERAIAADPRHPSAYDHKAVMFGRLGKFTEALVLLDRALEQLPSAAVLLSRRGKFSARLGKFEEAQIFLRRARQADPQDADAWLTEADVLHRLGRKDAALNSMETFLQQQRVAPRQRELALKLKSQLENGR